MYQFTLQDLNYVKLVNVVIRAYFQMFLFLKSCSYPRSFCSLLGFGISIDVSQQTSKISFDFLNVRTLHAQATIFNGGVVTIILFGEQINT